MSQVKTAVIPVAGLGTRFLPATKSIPKEMLPIVDKPTIQYIVEEAWAAGIETIVFVNGHHKSSIEDHFDYAYELEDTVSRRGKESIAQASRAIADLAPWFRSGKKRPGLGARRFGGTTGHRRCAFCRAVGRRHHSPAQANRTGHRAADARLRPDPKRPNRVDASALIRNYKYGAAEGERDANDETAFHISALVEKPPPGTEKTDQAVVGRYVLPPSIWPILVETGEGAGGEIQLTDALDTLRQQEGLMGCCFHGKRVDAGDKVGYLHANLLEALSREDLKDPVLSLLQSLVADASQRS